MTNGGSAGVPDRRVPLGKWRCLMVTDFQQEMYGQRWQIETVMFLIKQHQGETLTAHHYQTRRREMGLMAITHNIMIVTLEQGFLQGTPDPLSSPDRRTDRIGRRMGLRCVRGDHPRNTMKTKAADKDKESTSMHHRITCQTVVISLWLLIAWTGFASAQEITSRPQVRSMRVPNGGIQPQVVVDADGVVHMVYCKGDSRACNVFYIKSTDGGESFSNPMRVNRRDGSAVTAGTIRGPHLAIGRNGRPHVAWNGSAGVTPEGDHSKTPLLYARMNDEGDGFEPERNIITARFGLDGGSSIAADDAGNVFVVWHAPKQGGRGEEDRRVWVARSTDDGLSFAIERIASGAGRGACGCCGLRAFADRDGGVNILYRSAWDTVNRHMFLLNSSDGGDDFDETKVDDWTIGQCVMSSAAFTQTADRLYIAWETKKQVYFASIDPGTNARPRPAPAPGRGDNRKHPVLAANDRGQVILAWTEGTRWQKGGSVAWQVFDANGNPLLPKNARAEGLPVWGLSAVFTDPDGGFVVVY